MPTLSETKLNSLNTHMRKAYLKAEGIRENIMRGKLLNLEKLEAANLNATTVYQKGDLVKIRKVQGPGELKKLHRPFSNRNYEVLRVLTYCNSLLIQEVGHSVRVRPIRLRVHMRYCKKVQDREKLRDQRDKIIFNMGKGDSKISGQKSDSSKGLTHKSGLNQNSLISDDRETRLKTETKALFRKDSRLRPRNPINYKQ